jgi:lipopolysaccharide assembly protein A
MQLLLIVGIVFAISAVAFALQNNVPVTVALASWNFDSSLAVVLLVALGLGALIAGLVSTPGVIKGQWAGARLRRQATFLEEQKVSLEQRIHELELLIPEKAGTPVWVPEEIPPYVGLRAMAMAQEGRKLG